MLRIAGDKLTPGMVLAKPLLGKNGMVFLGEGTELTDRWIERIQDMQLDGIFVEGTAEPLVPLAEVLMALDERFATVLDKPHMGLLHKIVRKHIERLYPPQT
jgi:hypothetical protein